MKYTTLVPTLLFITGLVTSASAQPTPKQETRTASQVMRDMVSSAEKQITRIATEMPEDKYGFVPTQGEFKGVRSFGAQLKHAAAVNNLVAATLLGETVKPEMSDEKGPDAVKTKAEVLQYLKESFAALARAATAVDEKNAFAPVKGVFGSAPETRVGLITMAVSHSSNHYGQIVEYLRMNGIVPPGAP
jgi:uncharacterized damage-inducible protein DinB